MDLTVLNAWTTPVAGGELRVGGQLGLAAQAPAGAVSRGPDDTGRESCGEGWKESFGKPGAALASPTTADEFFTAASAVLP